jgi:hypothetical protein
MANVLLTRRCVRSCPYCFARERGQADARQDFLNWENLIYIVDFLEGSGEKHVSLLGGEPTLHPLFVEYLAYLLERRFHATVFTSGIMEEDKLESLALLLREARPEDISLVCNLNDPARSPPAEIKRIERFLDRVGPFVTPGFNMFEPDFDLRFIVDHVGRFGLSRHLRLGLAHPVPGAENACVGPEAIGALLSRLETFFPLLEAFKINPGFDCGFPLCKATDSQIGWLARHSGQAPRFTCGPAIDIGPDMTVWSCFPLSGLQRRSLFDFDDLAALAAFFEDIHRKARIEVGGIYLECDLCGFRLDGLCAGGCLSRVVSCFVDEHPIRMKEVYL